MKKLMSEISPANIIKTSLVIYIEFCTFCIFIILELISSTIAFAATLFVPGDYDTIQDAINASSTGDTVSVADGIYYENILFAPGPNKKTNITLVSVNGPESTVIYGDHTGSVVTIPANFNATLDGFTITNGSYLGGVGGGIRIGAGASPTIDNCIITNNKASAGGGISCGDSSTPFITNSIIQNNLASGAGHNNGGGLHGAPNSTPIITNCIFKDNTSRLNGGAMAFDTADLLIVNCIFDNNTADVSGGAISFKNSAPIITNCTFSNNNSLTNPGGAIACNNPLPGTEVTNSIFWGDHPAEIACDVDIICVTYSDIQGGPYWPANPDMIMARADRWPGTGNINSDPRFRDQATGDFHLTNDSPCIDAGDNSDLNLQSTDIELADRIIDDPDVADTGIRNGEPAIVDMGAFEKHLNDPSPCPIECGNEWTPPGLKVGVVGSGGDDGGEDGGGGNGIFGDILKSSVIGYHLDGITTKGVQVYMPVTLGFKALKGAQEYVRSFAPDLAEFVRKCFDFLEIKADSNKDGFLYNAGTNVFPILGKIAEKSLELIGEEKYIDTAYSDTTISIEDYKILEKKGKAIAPKVVKEIEYEKQEIYLSNIILVY